MIYTWACAEWAGGGSYLIGLPTPCLVLVLQGVEDLIYAATHSAEQLYEMMT